MSRFKLKIWLLIGGMAGLALAAVLAWRLAGPVQVRLATDIHDLPFEVQMIPPVVWARPGEMVRVIYRIRNTQTLPLEAFGKVEVVPNRSKDQIKVFLTQCGGLNTFQESVASDYEVFFRVQPAGLFGSSQLTLLHVFTRAVPPREQQP